MTAPKTDAHRLTSPVRAAVNLSSIRPNHHQVHLTGVTTWCNCRVLKRLTPAHETHRGGGPLPLPHSLITYMKSSLSNPTRKIAVSQWGLAARLRHRATPHRTCRPHPRWDPVRLPAHIVAPVSGHPAPFPNVVWDPTEQCKVRNRSNGPASLGGYINQVGTLGSLSSLKKLGEVHFSRGILACPPTRWCGGNSTVLEVSLGPYYQDLEMLFLSPPLLARGVFAYSL